MRATHYTKVPKDGLSAADSAERWLLQNVIPTIYYGWSTLGDKSSTGEFSLKYLILGCVEVN